MTNGASYSLGQAPYFLCENLVMVAQNLFGNLLIPFYLSVCVCAPPIPPYYNPRSRAKLQLDP